MTPLQQALWERIREHRFDDATARLTFTARLARENGWAISRAVRVVDEYRRFVFLAMTAGQSMTPSESCRRVDLESIAYQAVCMASMTYRPERSKPCTYFGSAIRHALYREVLSQAKQDGRYICVQEILDPPAQHPAYSSGTAGHQGAASPVCLRPAVARGPDDREHHARAAR